MKYFQISIKTIVLFLIITSVNAQKKSKVAAVLTPPVIELDLNTPEGAIERKSVV